MMKYKYILFILYLLLCLVQTNDMYADSYYYYEPFNTGSMGSEWENQFQYGREGWIMPEGEDSTETFNNNVLELRGHPYRVEGTADYNYNGIWIGTSIKNDLTYDATPEQPFGFEVIRKYARLNFYNNTASENNTIRCQNDVGIWLVIDNGASAQNEAFKYYLYFYDNIRWNLPAGDVGRSYIGYWNGTQNDINIGQATNALGEVINLSNRSILCFNWDYNPADNDTDTANTNQVGFRITHDGENIKLWINPDPDNDTPGYPNEWCLVQIVDVTWNANMKVMLGHNMRQRDLRRQEADFDDLLIRSAADVAEASISPSEVDIKPTTQTLTYCISNNIHTSNAGVNVIKITKPSECQWSTNPTNDITVMDYYNNTTIKTLDSVNFSSSWGFINDQVMIKTNGNEILLILGSQVTNRAAGEKGKIYVQFNFIISNTFTSAEFTSTVEAVQFENMGSASGKWGKYSTCGPQKTTGTVDLSIQKGPAEGYSSIVPNQIIQGSESYSFTYYLQSGDAYTKDITQAAIMIPPVFTIDTNTIDSFLLTDDSYAVVTNIPALGGAGTNFILLKYSAAGKKIDAGGVMDIITFSIKSDTQKGTHQWSCWVDDTVVDGTSEQTGTNLILISQQVKVSGAPPKVAGGISKPVNADPVVLFNVITVNTLEYRIENRAPASEADNKIQCAVLTIPAIFTNITSITSRKISSANWVFYQGTGGNVSVMTLFYARGNAPVNPAYDYDTIRFISRHNITNNQTTNVAFSCVINNSNGQGYYDLSVELINDLTVTDPIPIGSVKVTVDDSYVYTTDVTNSYTYMLKNTAPSGKILYSVITIPTNYFSAVLNINSSRSSTGINLNWPDIEISYTNQLDIYEYDMITFDLVDKYTNRAVPGSGVLEGIVANTTKTNPTSDKDASQGETRTVYFVPQEARAKCYTLNKDFLSSLTTFTLYYVISNYGEPGNKISAARIYFTNTMMDFNIGDVTSSLGGVASEPVVKVLQLDYSGVDFNANQSDIIEIIGTYGTIGVENDYTIASTVTVNTSILVPAGIKSGDDIFVHFEIPYPSARSYITPNIVFTSTSNELNYMNYIISNSGVGQNDIIRAEINIPSLYLSHVTILSSTVINNDAAALTNKSNKLVINYAADSGNKLSVGQKDTVTFVITNAITDITNAGFRCLLYNADKNKTSSVVSGRSTNIDVIEQSLIAVTPQQRYTTDIINTNTFTIQNGSSLEGVNIVCARITINTQFYNYSSLQIASDHNISVQARKTNIGSKYYYWIDYSANKLTPGNDDMFTMRLSDKMSTTNHIYWETEVDYNDGYGFRSSKGQSADANKVNFIYPNVSALAWITPNSIPDLNVQSVFQYVISNTGVTGNDITMVRIKVPVNTFTNIVFLSNRIMSTNLLLGTGVISNIIINYAAKGSSIPAGSKDVISFRAYDNHPSGAGGPFIWQSDAANTVDSNFVNPTTLNDISVPVSNPNGQKVYIAEADFAAEANIYQSGGGKINTVDSMSTLVYYIKNISKEINNNISQIQITVPTSHFLTNNILSSMISSNSGTISKNGNVISINYAIPLPQDEKEYIVFQNILDSYIHGSTNNVPWNITIQFDTSPSNFITPSLAEGGKQSVDFEMPYPEASADIMPQQIYTTSTTNIIIVKVTNTGDGSNDLDKVQITVPAIFTNSILSDGINTRISSSKASNISYSAQIVTLQYSNSFKVNTADTFNFKIVDKIGTEESRDWFFRIYNIKKDITINPPLAPIVNVRTPPFASIRCTNTVDLAGRVPSTAVTNIFEVMLDNKGSCTNIVSRALIKSPYPFTLLLPISSQLGGTIINNVTSMTIDYGLISGLKKNQVDKIVFRAVDCYEIGATNNVAWNIFIKDGQQYANTQIPEGLKQHVDFYTPDPNVAGYITPEGIVNTNSKVNFIYYFINQGLGENDIRKLVIDIPSDMEVLTNLANVAVSPVGTVVSSAQTQIVISFADNTFNPGDTVQVTFTMTNNFHTSETNVSFPSWIANITNGTLYPVAVQEGKEQDLEIRFPTGISFGYVVQPPSGILFTIDTNKNIEYWLENNNPFGISTAKIYMTNINFKVLQVESDHIYDDDDLTCISISNGNIITLNYGVDVNGSLARDDKDIIDILVKISNNITKCTVISLLDTEPTKPIKTGANVLEIRTADFGRIKGKVFPTSETATVKILDKNGHVVTPAAKYTNLYANDIIKDDTNGSDGEYLLDFVPAGTYTLVFSSENYRTSYKYKVKVYNNQYTFVGNVRLRNKVLDSGENLLNVRKIIADDGKSYAAFPLLSVLKDFYLDIYKKSATAAQIGAVSGNETILKPKSASALRVFNFALQNTKEADINEIEIGESITICLYYTDSEISAQGWKEDSLAIYYFKENTGEWVKLGGKVDKANNCVSIKVNYLHANYALFGSKAPTFVKVYGDLKIWPNPFTPGRGGSTYQNMKISFILKNPVDDMLFRVYDMMGRMIYEKEYIGTYSQGEIYWDGKDNDGYVIKSGIYIFQIETGSEYYRGKLMIIK